MNKYIEVMIFVMFLSLLVLGGFILGIIFTEKNTKGVYLDYVEDIPLNYTQCENKSLIQTSYCLRNYVKTFYNYKVREDVEINLSELMEDGGDCFNWANLYIKMFGELGFKADYFQRNGIVENKTRIFSAHRWAVAWDNETRCEIDQLKIDCFER